MDAVDYNEQIWALSNTGTKMHAFVQMVDGSENHKRAMCRKTTTRNVDAKFVGQDIINYSQICESCLNKAVASGTGRRRPWSPLRSVTTLGT